MKRVILMALIMLMPMGLMAQEENDKSKQNIINITIPKKWYDLKDKIFVQNKSSIYILQVVVAVEDENGKLKPLGSSTHIAPNATVEIASFSNNTLKRLRGKVLAIKAKGSKVILGEDNKAPDLNNVKPSDITYNFEVNLSKSRHDLYVELFSTEGNGVMDF